MRNYPWVPPAHYHDKGETGANIMKPLEALVVIQDEELEVGEMGTFSFVYLARRLIIIFRPFFKHQQFQWLSCTSRPETHWIRYESKAGTSNRFVERNSYSPCTSSKNNPDGVDVLERSKKCTFSIQDSTSSIASRMDVSDCLEEAVLQLRKEVPLELVVNMFQKLVCLFHHASLLSSANRPIESSSYIVHAGRGIDWNDNQDGHGLVIDG